MIQAAAEMSDIKCLEHHTLKVPYEVLNKRFRATQKVFDREASHVQQTAADLEKVCYHLSNWYSSLNDTYYNSRSLKLLSIFDRLY